MKMDPSPLELAWRRHGNRTALTHDGKHVGYHAGLYLEVQRSITERKHGFKVKTTTRISKHTQSTQWLLSVEDPSDTCPALTGNAHISLTQNHPQYACRVCLRVCVGARQVLLRVSHIHTILNNVPPATGQNQTRYCVFVSPESELGFGSTCFERVGKAGCPGPTGRGCHSPRQRGGEVHLQQPRLEVGVYEHIETVQLCKGGKHNNMRQAMCVPQYVCVCVCVCVCLCVCLWVWVCVCVCVNGMQPRKIGPLSHSFKGNDQSKAE